jgi:diadenosine tetraphosphate (Ap4A) HIT family hydrolase
MSSPAKADCALCREPGGAPLWHDDFCRVVRPAVEGYPAFCRVIVQRHVKEMTDLAVGERARLMGVVFACEAALRRLCSPEKINLASLGNQVPHLHWHVIARFADDAHFPGSIWSAPRRAGALRAALDDRRLAAEIARAIIEP